MTRFMTAAIALAAIARTRMPTQPAAPNSVPAGSSRIEKISGGCALLENWTSRAGTQGKSINFYNRVARQWQQYWVGQSLGDATQFTMSEWNGATLVFYADAIRPDGTKARPIDAPASVARLVQLYGDAAALTLADDPIGGAVARVTLPLRLS